MLNETKNNIRYACASQRHHTNYCYIRETSAAAENSSPRTCHLEVANVTDVPTHIESFLMSHPRVQPSYAVDLHIQNAKSANFSLLSNLYNCSEEEDPTNAVALNLTSIEAVRMAAECPGDIRIQKDCCFSAPAKSRRHILEALSLGVNRMTVSYPAEVMRISSASKSVELVLSLASSVDDKEASRVAETLRVARAKGMKVVGIALRWGWDHPVAPHDVEEALVRLRDAYDEATSCGHDVCIIDLGSLIARSSDSTTKPIKRRRSCSVIMEDGHLSRIFCESAFDEEILPRVQTNALLDQHFPPSLGLRVLAEHAQYLFPQAGVLQKWFTTPKERRPAPSFHSYMTSGCTTKTAYICSYRSKTRAVRDSEQTVVNEVDPAAAQA